MVMETPGPQEVGREFVRQYYTMLHGAPLHLHRFYSNNSAFVHGGIEDAGSEQPPVIGQEAIHKKIVSLNFNDCHAKIRQVDAQATIEDSVVVQVTGELSNNGEPMRRFMQTFVLVPQTPKKFYVHNDIFRYQDEVFHDDGDIEEASHTSFITDHREEEMENGSIQEPVSTSGDVATSYYDHVPVSIDATDEEESAPVFVPSQPTKPQQAAVIVTEREPVHLEETSVEQVDQFEEKVEAELAPVAEPLQIEFHETQQPEVKPVTWAALASKNTPGGLVPVATTYSVQMVSHASKPPPSRSELPKTDAVSHQRGPRTPRERIIDRDRTSASRVDSDGDADSINGRSNSVGGGSRYSDTQQLFIGNLPQNITERELKEFFEYYGKVEELRINTKSSGGKLPNFGFVVFESAETAQKILQSKPIMYNGQHRLNVEEKKPRNGDGMRGSGRGGMGRGGGFGGRSTSQTYGGEHGGPGSRGGQKGGNDFNSRQDIRGPPNLGPRGGLAQQGRR